MIQHQIAKRRKNTYLQAPNRSRTAKSIQIRSIDSPKRGLIKIAIIELIVGIIIYWGTSSTHTAFDIEEFIKYYVIAAAFALPWFFYYIRYGLKTKCHHCKCFYTIKFVSRNAIAKEDILVKSEEEVLTEGIDYDTGEVRDVITYQEELRPGTRTTYLEMYKCKWCNAHFKARYTIDR